MKKHSLLLIFIISILLIIFGILINEFNDIKYNDKYFDSNYETENDVLISLKKDEKITQKITIDNDVKYIVIPFEIDYYEDRIGEFVINIIEDEKVVSTYKVTNKLMKDSKYLINTNNLKAGTYDIEIIHSKIYGDTKVIGKECKDNCSKINNKKQEFQVAIYLKYSDSFKAIFFYSTLFGIFILISIITLKVLNKNLKLEKKFLILALPIYLMYVFVIPPTAVHDEKGHWVRVFEITEGNILVDVQDDRMGSILPKNISMNVLNNNQIKYKDILFNQNINYSDVEFLSDEKIFMYRRMQYFPQIIGVKLSKVFTNKTIIIFYCGRLFNLGMCLLCLYFAIKLIPYMKKLIFLISFIPVAIEGCIGLTGDGLIISIVFLFISYVLYLNNDKDKINRKDILILSLLGVFIACSKMVYVPIVCSLFLLKNSLFKTKKSKVLFISLVLLIGIILDVLWINSINKFISVYTDGKSVINLNKAISNPLHFFYQIIYSIEHNGLNILTEMFGSKLLHYEYIKNSTLIPLTYLILSIVIVLNEKKERKLNLILIASIIIIEILLIFSSLYFYWSDTYNFNITGVQGRYFILLLPFIYILINQLFGKKLNINSNKLEKIMIISCAITNYIVIMKIILASI